MAGRHPFFAWASLAVVALAAAGLWRADFAWNGWDGLFDLDYFRWATPITAAALVAWIAVFSGPMGLPKKIAIITIEAAFVCVALWVMDVALWIYNGVWRYMSDGPSGFSEAIQQGYSWKIGSSFVQVPALLAVAAFPLAPILGCFIARAFGACRSWKNWVGSIFLFIAAFPATNAVVGLTGFSLETSIQTVKTAFILPLLITAMGMPFLPLSRRESSPSEGPEGRQRLAGGDRREPPETAR